MLKPTIQEQIDFMDEHIELTQQSIGSISCSDSEESETTIKSMLADLDGELRMAITIKENLIAVRNWQVANARIAKPETRNPEPGTWTERINARIKWLTRVGKDASTNRNGGTIVFAADAPELEATVRDLEELKKRIPTKAADYES